MRTLLLAGASMLCLASAEAKTLVYCSEGSPENFNPMLNTTGTTFDANHPVYSRLIEFKPGETAIEPGLAESWDISPDGKVFTLHLRHGVKWHSNAQFKPTRDFNADDVLFSFDRQAQGGQPVPQGFRRQLRVLRRHGPRQADHSASRRSIRLHGPLHPLRAERAVPRRPRDGVRLHPVGRIRRHADEGRQARADRPGADRHRAVQLRRLPAGRHHPLPPLRRVLGSEGQARRAGLLHQQGPGRPPGQAARQ